MEPIEIRARREALGLAQHELADLFDVKQETVSRWEQGIRAPRDPIDIHTRLREWEDLYGELVAEALDAMEAESGTMDRPQLTYRTFRTDHDYWQADDRARKMKIPAAMHRVAAAQAAWQVEEDFGALVSLIEHDSHAT